MGVFSSKIYIPGSKMVYGYHPDKLDSRDHKRKMNVHRSIKESSVKVVDLRDRCPSVYDQGKLGSCTANAICGNYSYIYLQEKLLPPSDEKFFSRLFLYWNEREIEGTIEKDSGASLRDGLKAVNKIGVPFEEYWPYDIDKYSEKPSNEAFERAHRHIAIRYERLERDIHQLKQCLLNGDPFVFGFTVYESFESDEVAKTGMMSVPKEDEKLLGGHAVMAVGFDDSKRAFIIRNSWGENWGIDGYFYMPYDFMFGKPHDEEIPYFTSDHWAIDATDDTNS